MTKLSILFVDDDQNLLFGIKRALRVRQKEWSIYFAESGEEALSVLANNSIDIIVTDISMRGIDGTTLLQQTLKLYPSTVRLVLSGYSSQDVIVHNATVTHQLLAKPCEINTLINIFDKIAKVRNSLQNQELLKIATGLGALPSVPGLYEKILSEIEAPQASIQKISDIVAQDLTLTARILQLVNSAFFGLPQKVLNLQQAISLLGLEMLKALVLYVKLFSTIPDKINAVSFSSDNLWKHSLHTAHLAKKIALSEGAEKELVDEAFIGGLLHDIGKLVMLQMPEYAKAVANMMAKNQCQMAQAEYQLYNASHAETGAYVLGLWDMPNNILEAVMYHHTPSQSNANRLVPLLAVHVADVLLNASCSPDNANSKLIDQKYVTNFKATNNIGSWSNLCFEVCQKESN
ncbi:MAG: response regulator [Peptococcaceae bacterium]|nr:response regulator [Peptococcaceae bacterium]